MSESLTTAPVTPQTHASTEDAERWAYGPDATARLLNVSPTSVRKAVRNGTIPAIRIGRRLLIPRAAIEKLLAGNK